MTAIPPSEQTALIERLREAVFNLRERERLRAQVGSAPSVFTADAVELMARAADMLVASASREQELIDLKASYAETSADYLENRKALEAAEAQATARSETIDALVEEVEAFTGWWSLNREGSVNRAYDHIDKAVKRLRSACEACDATAALHASPAPKGGESNG